jgi:chromosomal replication initiation ATPase DnaA
VNDVRGDLAGAWNAIQRELASSMHEDTYRLWIAPLAPVSRRGATLYVTGPQRVIRWVGRRYMELVRAATARAGVDLKQIELVSDAGAQLEAGAPREAASRVALNPD